MKPDTQLDYAVFQLTPTRTRCELHVAAQGKTYKLASGLLKPFVAHLRAAEEQLAKGGYSIRLEPPDPGSASWFTKGTMERFVRFVSTPEVLERVSTVEVELIELEETLNLHINDTNEANESVQVDDQLSKTAPSSLSTGGKPLAPGSMEKPALPLTKAQRESADGVDSAVEENSKQRLLRALDARRMVLQKEQGMAFARAIAAGFLVEHMGDLVVFAECFGASRLREACIKFMALCQKRQEAGLWLEDLDLAAAEAGAHSDMAFMGVPGENAMGSFFKSREYPDAWSDLHGGDMKLDDHHRASYPNDGRMFIGEDGAEKRLTRHGSLENQAEDYWQLVANMRQANGSGIMGDFTGEYGQMHRGRSGPVPVGGLGSVEDPLGNGEYREGETGRAPSLVRGHPVMAAWQGQPQNQYIRSHSPHGTLHPHPSLPTHLESPYGFAGPGRGAPPGVAYPQYMGSPYMQPNYTDSSPNWMGQVQPPLPPQYWPGNQGYVDSPRPMAWEHAEGSTHSSEHQEANSARNLSREKEQRPPSVHVKQSSHGSGEEIVCRDGEESMYSSGKLSDGRPQKVTDPSTPEYVNRDESLYEVDEDLPTRRSRRSASPSRRSSSPMRRVQVGRSGPRRSGMVVIRNINYIAPNSQDRSNKGDDGAESSSSWSEDGDSAGNGESTAESVRVSVQDVIGLFENQKGDSNDTRKSSSKKGKSSSKKAGLSRWTDAGDASEETNDEYRENSGTRAIAMDDAEVVEAERPSSYQKDLFNEEASFFPERMGRGRPNSSSHDVDTEMESKAGNHSHRGVEVKDDMLILPDERAPHLHSTEVFADEQQGPTPQKLPIADDSFMLADQAEFRGGVTASDRGALDLHSELANNQTEDFEEPLVDNGPQLDDSIVMLNRSGAQERNAGWSMPLNLESEMPVDHYFDMDAEESVETSNNFEPDDLFMMPERSKEAFSRDWSSPLDYDMQLSAGEVIDDDEHQVEEEGAMENGSPEHEDAKTDKAKAINPKKNEREAKAKAMQEMLERRRAGVGKRGDKPNPLAEAQLRAEKLRAYKASLQKSKKEKEEEERKRIEDLKNQRRERIAARSGAQAGARSQPTPPLTISKSSPTTPASRKVAAASSPREPIASLSPNVARAKASNGSRLLPRPSPKASPSPKPAENPLSRSVSTISELRKETHKPIPSVRASTGSQRLSQLKNVANEADKEASTTTKARASSEKVAGKDVSTIKANGHAETKKRPVSTITAKKSSPATKETNGEASSPAKPPAKTQSVARKQQKTTVNSPSAAKSSPRKETPLITETAPVATTQQAESEARDVNDAGCEVTTSPSFLPQENNKPETTIKAVESPPHPSPREEEKVEADNGHAQIRSPGSIDTMEEVPRTAQLNDEMVTSDALGKILEEPKEDTSFLDDSHGPSFPNNSQSEYQTFVLADGPMEPQEGTDGSPIGEDYRAPIAHASSLADDSAGYEELDVNDNEGPYVSVPEHPAAANIPLPSEQNNPLSPLAESPVDISSKNLPRLQEAMQQAHSPDAVPVKIETARSRKKWGDSVSQKTSKEHAKGFKRLLRLGRKSSRTSSQNASEWISASTTSDNDEDGDEVRDLPSSIGKNLGRTPSLESTGTSEQGRSSVPAQQQLKTQDENNSGNPSTKASRSFFSLSTFRSKNAEGKVRS